MVWTNFLKRARNSFIYLLIILLGIGAGIFLFWKPSPPEGVPAVETSSVSQSLRCGINSVYLALRYLDFPKSGISLYHELAESFPEVEAKGMSLAQIQTYLQTQGFSTRVRRVNSEDLKKLNPSAVLVAFVTGEPVAHVFIVRKTGKGVLQVVDSTDDLNGLRIESAEDLGKRIRLGLFVSKDEKHLPSAEGFLVQKLLSVVIAVAAFGAILTIGISSFIAWRRRRKQKKRSLLNPLVFFLLLSPLFTACEEKNSGVVCSEPVFDFGRLPENQFLSDWHKYVIENKTDSDVSVRGVKIECSCVQAKMESNVIPPRGKVNLLASIQLNPDEVLGRKVALAVVFADDNVSPLRLSISARASYSVLPYPSSIVFGEIFNVGTSRKEFEIISTAATEENDFVRDISIKNPEIFSIQEGRKFTLQKKNTKGESFFENRRVFSLSLSLPKETPIGVFTSSLTVTTKSDRKIEIPISWSVKKKSLFEPDLRPFVLYNLLENEKREFQLIYNEDVGGKVKSIRTSSPEIAVQGYHSLDDSICIKLYFLSKNQHSPDSKLGELIVETEDGREHRLEIIAS